MIMISLFLIIAIALLLFGSLLHVLDLVLDGETHAGPCSDWPGLLRFINQTESDTPTWPLEAERGDRTCA
jgi:hypothetical protein